METNWIDKKKIGDKVGVILSSTHGDSYHEGIIKRKTKNLVVLDRVLTNRSDLEFRFRSTDGYESGSNIWHRNQMVPYDQIQNKIEIQKLTNQVKNKIKKIQIPTDVDKLTKLLSILNSI